MCDRQSRLAIFFLVSALTSTWFAQTSPAFGDYGLQRIPYNHPGLIVDLGVGLYAWPVPMDFNGDGRLDLVVVCPDVPYNGTYFFENTGSDAKMPVFKPAVRISQGLKNAQVSHVEGNVRVTTPGYEYPDFLRSGLERPVKLPVGPNIHPNQVRANQWKYVDYDGDGKLDLIVGVEDWTDYGWDNAFDASGKWTHGPLHGFVYLLRNKGGNEQPDYELPVKIEAGGSPIDVFGMPSPCFADFRGAGKLDLICGSFLTGFTYFENLGTRTQPKYAAGRPLTSQGRPLTMDSQMIVPVAMDWDGDGDADLIVGQEDSRVAFMENTGKVADGMPQFLPPRFFQQQAADVKFGVLVTPAAYDWDADGNEDLICGNASGYIGFIRNLGGQPPKWAAPKHLEADGEVIHVVAGPNGSIQGPAEATWGYTVLSVADWDHDGLPDVVANSIWGKVVWYKNVGTRTDPRLTAAQPIEVQWPDKPPKPAWNWWNPVGKELVTQWRTTPAVRDFDHDGLNDLVMLDHEGYLGFFRRERINGQLALQPPRRDFLDEQGKTLRLTVGAAGASGRRKLCFADWDLDGRIDLLVNSQNVNFLRNTATADGKTVLRDMGAVDTRQLAGHTTQPTVVHWRGDGFPDLLVGAEDGHLYYLQNPHAKSPGNEPQATTKP